MWHVSVTVSIINRNRIGFTGHLIAQALKKSMGENPSDLTHL